MFRNIAETQKLFKIEGLREDGRVDVKISKHFVSLSEDEQIKILTAHLERLKKDLAELQNPALQGSLGKGGEVQITQMQLLIGVIEGLLAQI